MKCILVVKEQTAGSGTENRKHLTVPAEGKCVVFLPGRAGRCVVVAMSLAQSTVLLSDRGETTSLTTLVNRVADPVNTSIPADLYHPSLTNCFSLSESKAHTAL